MFSSPAYQRGIRWCFGGFVGLSSVTKEEKHAKRWAAVKGKSGTSPQPAKAKPKRRRMSAEGRRPIIEATKKQCGRVKAEAAKKTGRKRPVATEKI
jgi:hypothetical protein